MVDIHSHILPGIDDGSESLDESLAMLELAATSGTTDIVATPHANSSYVFDGEVVADLIAELTAQVRGSIKIHSGCDLHLNFDNLANALESPRKYTVNGGRYLMVELPDMASLPVMRSVLDRLLAVRIVPIITHPERNGSLCANLPELEAWVHDGCLLQVTALSFTGRFGQTAQRVSETLMNSQMVHFVASDAHDCVDRSPNMSPAYQLVNAKWGGECANALFTDYPTAVIRDEPIFPPPPKRPPKKSIFTFWK